MANPVLNSSNFKEQMKGGQSTQTYSAEQLQQMYSAPAASPQQMGRMTYGDVINKSILLFGTVLIGAAFGWFFANPVQNVVVYLGAALVGFVLGLVNSFKREPSPVLILIYGLAQGVFLGGLSVMLDTMYPGVAVQALLGTLTVFAVVMVLFRSGKVRATPRANKIFMVLLISYGVFSLINFGLMMFGVTDSMFGLRSGWLGVVIGLIAIGLASYSLVMDFTQIEAGVNHGAPSKYSWTAAFGLAVTLIWLYVEILRLLSILREMSN